jgi:ribulose-phosphate 3-epimerase
MVTIVPTLLCQTVEELSRGWQRWQGLVPTVQIDFADGEFVSNRLPRPEDLPDLPADLKFECHLMVKQPDQWVIQLLTMAQVETIIVHLESQADMVALAHQIKAAGRRFGLALKPATPLAALQPYLPLADQVLLLGVEPGFNGSPFMPSVIDKVSQLRSIWPAGVIEVDGGISPATIGPVTAAGATQVAVGSALSNDDPQAGLTELMAAAAEATR